MTSSSERFGLEHLIDRPSLRSTLDTAFDRRLSLIVAPAGAGKTTLLRQWSAAHPNHAFVFLDIEAADDRPAHFTRRLVDALAAVEPGMARVVQDAGLGAPLIAALATAVETMPDVVIVVDDAQRFSNVQLVAELGELAGQTPRNVHLVVSSRSDPPIALGRYRLEDELLELRQAELAFTDEEAAELLERIAGQPLTSSNVRALRERTEGWAAGLQLAGLNLRHEPDPDAFIAEFGGSDRLVADYFGEEVLAFLPAERRDLLLRMSALDDMCAGLVQAATGCADAQAVLEELERDSLFLVRMDAHREWFRFHHLFRDLLRSRLGAESASAERQVISAAADWQLARGQAKCAVEYLLRAQLWDQALLTAREARLLAHPAIADAYLASVLTAAAVAENNTRAPRALQTGGAVVQTSTPTVLFERAVSSLTLGDTEQARGVVRAWDYLVPEPDPLSVVQRHILLAWVAVTDNAPDEGMRQLTEAVRVAEIHGLVSVFVRAGPMILKRLHDIAGPQTAFRDIILARARQSSAPAPERDLRDPLTDREMEILSYLPTRFTNVELAQRCFVSVNTIKTHMVHIYRKLDATNRDAAIDRARVLGLL